MAWQKHVNEQFTLTVPHMRPKWSYKAQDLSTCLEVSSPKVISVKHHRLIQNRFTPAFSKCLIKILVTHVNKNCLFALKEALNGANSILPNPETHVLKTRSPKIHAHKTWFILFTESGFEWLKPFLHACSGVVTSCVSDGVILLASGRWSSPANLMAWPTADKGTFLLARLTNWNGLDHGKGQIW
jgi:hypothetical protein